MVPLLNPSVTAVALPEGQSVWVFGDRYTIKVAGAKTRGAFALVECLIYPESFSPPHIHHAEDEMFYILEGTLTVWAGGKTIHAFKNESEVNVRVLIMFTPAGFEQYFLAVGVPVSEAHPTPPPIDSDAIETMIRLAPTYHMEVTTTL